MGVLIVIGLMIIGAFFLYTKNSKNHAAKSKQTEEEWPIIDTTFDDVVKAVRQFSLNLPNGVSRTILVQADHSIDFKQLAPILKGIPSKPYFMSKETYDIFEEDMKHLPPILDKVQKAVDHYVKDHKEFPVTLYDPLRRVNYYLLIRGHYLDEKPDIDLYITDYDGLISVQKPKKNSSGK